MDKVIALSKLYQNRATIVTVLTTKDNQIIIFYKERGQLKQRKVGIKQ